MDDLTELQLGLARLIVDKTQLRSEIKLRQLQFDLDIDTENLNKSIEEDTIVKSYHVIEFARYAEESSDNEIQVEFSKLALRQCEINIISLNASFATDIANSELLMSELDAHILTYKQDIRMIHENK